MIPFQSSLVSDTVLDNFSEGLRGCIRRLMDHKPIEHDLSIYSRSQLAAVLVLLFEQNGELRVLLTTRSKALRTHPGQTALPGGRMDESDKSLIETAFREAHEEIGLPLNCPNIYTVTLLEPLISLYRLVVTPVVAILTSPSVLDQLKAAEREVSCIFSHPLSAILDPALSAAEPLVSRGSEDWPYETDFYHTTDSTVSQLGGTAYRMHRFRSSASPIKGLTADILISTAEITLDKGPVYGKYALDQLKDFSAMQILLRNLPQALPLV